MYVRPKKALLISARCLYKRHLGARNLADQILISLIKMQINFYNFVEMRFFLFFVVVILSLTVKINLPLKL